VDTLLAEPGIASLPHEVATASIRFVLDEIRAAISEKRLEAVPDVVPLVLDRAQSLLSGKMRGVINATGIVVHTNLGRSPWPQEALDAAQAVARSYCNLEMDLETGKRGGRLSGLKALAGHLFGCEDAIVVNNCAAAVLLALTTLSKDREVVVSRGELVEIGGSYRVPAVIASGGARLVEVGTTNRTRLADYEAVIGEDTAVLLKVHHSNFRIVGFTEETALADLVPLGRAHGLAVVQDLGSGSVQGLCDEPSVAQCVSSGADVVLFSGDKLLGGPQAGLAVGKRSVIEAMRTHPLYRALRVDKVTLAALEATLAVHVSGSKTPVRRMIESSEAELTDRAERLTAALEHLNIRCQRQQSVGFVGGGSVPGFELPSQVVVVESKKIDEVATALRCGSPAVVGRIYEGAFWLDVRTLRDDEVPLLAQRIAAVVKQP